MPQVVAETFDMLLDLGAETLIGALFLATLLALLVASVYLRLRRGKSDVMMLLVSMILVANLACLVTGASFVQSKDSPRRIGPYGGDQANQRVSAPRRFAHPGTTWRRPFSPRRAPAKQPVNSDEAPAAPG
jgi:hypothetical protein